ncbi:TTL domain-containing protein [Verticillium dahliae VdLs.17]|uniref:TTL domain-containing protein n=1 Tax=Verticillium dahliae (strain VdLs.17 / ATCC MYA-4575 / FGSC 10137) TaxID=498257 RepID=G2XJG5_VERDV|nr:TTL domain-containing protein [Verticillium dahliae VdLs.17]EGY20668.1 TTL domain-containing protein [Verticillium dahliae VdLs.17]
MHILVRDPPLLSWTAESTLRASNIARSSPPPPGELPEQPRSSVSLRISRAELNAAPPEAALSVPQAAKLTHIQIVNDDGPPSVSSPYFAPFLAALHAAGHTTVVVIPDRPLSWIAKAHPVGKTLTATPYLPMVSAHEERRPADGPYDPTKHWLLVDGPPASCIQLGLFHTGSGSAFDLVISGPNHGRNSGALHTLSSGTVGGALEAALCGRRAIALSFGSKEVQTDRRITDACLRSCALVEELAREWAPGVELYSVNVPMIDSLTTCPARYTKVAANRWSKGSLFAPGETQDDTEGTLRFRWAPDLADVHRSAEVSEAGEDLWCSLNESISVTPLKANFAAAQTQGEAPQGLLVR